MRHRDFIAQEPSSQPRPLCVAVHEDRRVVVVAAHPAAGARLGLGAALDPLHGRSEGPDHEEPELRPRR